MAGRSRGDRTSYRRAQHRRGERHRRVATPHREAAFEAARFGIDTIKERVPIWKKEVWDDGESWVGIHA